VLALLAAVLLAAVWTKFGSGGIETAAPAAAPAGAPAVTVGGTTAKDTSVTVAGTAGEPTDPEEDSAEEDAGAGTDPGGGFPDSDPIPEPEPAVEDQVDDAPVPLWPPACEAVLAAGASLLVSPDPLVLAADVTTSHLTITNCGEQDVEWSAATKPTVALDTLSSTLPAAITTLLGFSIDFEAYEPGLIEFKIKVSEPGHNHYINVSAYRAATGKDLVPSDIGLTAGVEAGGCANQCIITARVTPSALTPDLTLKVTTNTKARMKVWVSTQMALLTPAGEPYFPNVDPTATLPVRRTSWVTTLEPLQPATKYFVILEATDVYGHASYRTGSFTTITPLENPDGFALGGVEPGCANQCITKALVRTDDAAASASIEVASFTPATFTVWVSTKDVHFDGDIPGFSDVAPAATSEGQFSKAWSASLGELAYRSDYRIIVRATDVNGHRAYRVGTFTTPNEPTHDVSITLHKIYVSYDGDPGINRGELSLRWGFDDTVIGSRGEAKVSSETTIALSGAKYHFVATDNTTFLPTVYVVGAERDWDLKAEAFCTAAAGLFHSVGSDSECDLKWNIAASGIIAVGSIAGLERCSTFGIEGVAADDGCVLIETESHGDGYARFYAIVSYSIVG